MADWVLGCGHRSPAWCHQCHQLQCHRAGEVLALMELSGTQHWRGMLGEICPPKAAEDFFL